MCDIRFYKIHTPSNTSFVADTKFQALSIESQEQAVAKRFHCLAIGLA